MCTILEELSNNYKFVNENANISLEKEIPLLSSDDYKELKKVFNDIFSRMSKDEAVKLINALLESEDLLGSTVVYIDESDEHKSENNEKLHTAYVDIEVQVTVVAPDKDILDKFIKSMFPFIKGLLEKITAEVIVDMINEKISDMDMSGLFEMLMIKYIKVNENGYITA